MGVRLGRWVAYARLFEVASPMAHAQPQPPHHCPMVVDCGVALSDQLYFLSTDRPGSRGIQGRTKAYRAMRGKTLGTRDIVCLRTVYTASKRSLLPACYPSNQHSACDALSCCFGPGMDIPSWPAWMRFSLPLKPTSSPCDTPSRGLPTSSAPQERPAKADNFCPVVPSLILTTPEGDTMALTDDVKPARHFAYAAPSPYTRGLGRKPEVHYPDPDNLTPKWRSRAEHARRCAHFSKKLDVKARCSFRIFPSGGIASPAPAAPAGVDVEFVFRRAHKRPRRKYKIVCRIEGRIAEATLTLYPGCRVKSLQDTLRMGRRVEEEEEVGIATFPDRPLCAAWLWKIRYAE
ncbi:hypothetical protein FA95DRAFT_107885 [Auriscalpium vulgare]|uniref:Uncharacterized protein n=1 Tax=Auriscalpium vulgare TaxID=40419 RepID=A0ACB8S7N9_9AGAM|nr:hypothetical protein FA95DRAFT_107885 [Auriscalpium vulgare]